VGAPAMEDAAAGRALIVLAFWSEEKKRTAGAMR